MKFDIKKLLGKKIKYYRVSKGYSQEQFSEMLNISQRTLSGIECGTNFLTSQTLNKIFEVLGVTPDEMFYVSHLKPKKELISELISDIMSLEADEEKLQTVYKLVKAIIN